MRRWIAIGVLGVGILSVLWIWLGKSGETAVEPSATDIERALSLRPNNPALAAIYERSCFSCHADVDAQAPLAGHRAAWAPRLKARSMEMLVASVQGGYQAMPAMGFCPDCTEIEFRALIAFMAGEVRQ